METLVGDVCDGVRHRESVEPKHRFLRRGQGIDLRVVPVGHDASLGYALVFGNPKDDCLVRLHSRCLYGDALASDDCDCGPELRIALDQIQFEGCGVLVYLEQEGRGAGLVDKARGYRISQQYGKDSFDSYRMMGLEPDTRSYTDAALILLALGLTSVRLLTNNPDKVRVLREEGLTVTMVSLHVDPPNTSVRDYLRAKRIHRGHYLPRWWWMHRQVGRVRRACMPVIFGLGLAELARFLRPHAITVWEWLGPPAHVLPGAFAASAVGLAGIIGLIAGRYFSPRRRLLTARTRSLLSRNRLRYNDLR
ncbi:GTP cyclohydrolase II RibA [Nocardia sp. JMUB6875]|uniref:GTP cyclohydrolase II RibA n=1 Tax=Nocardia sp. JMUB6875 TaxID=3158170 RepID=UPI0034E8F2BD